MKLEELKNQLKKQSVIKFTFNKKDNTTGEALATLNEFLIPKSKEPNKEQIRNLGTNLKYYDLKKQGWRSLVYDCSTIIVDEEFNTNQWDELVNIMIKKKNND